MRQKHKYEYEPSLIVIYRSTFQAVTMCINVYQEDIGINHTENSIWSHYGYCISVLSVGKFLTAIEIYNCYKQGIAKNIIVKFPDSSIGKSIYDLVSFNKGVINLKDLTDKSTTKQKRFILALYDTNSANCYLQLKTDRQHAEFKDFKMEIFQSNFIYHKNLAIFRYDYTDKLSKSATIQLTEKNNIMHCFALGKLNIRKVNFIFNLQFQPNKGPGESFSINPPGKPIVSPILQLYYFYVYMMQNYRSGFKVEILINEYEMYCGNTRSNADEEILVCKLIGEHLNSFPSPLENFVIGHCLIICSYLKPTHMIYFNMQSTVSILESLSRTDNVIAEFKTSKSLSRVLKGIAYQIIRLKQEKNTIIEGISCLAIVNLLLDSENAKDLRRIIVQLAPECAGAVFNQEELEGLEDHCDKEAVEDFTTLYNALSLYTDNIFKIIEYLEKIIDKNAKINEDTVLYLKTFINDNNNCRLEMMVAVAITINNKNELLNIFTKIGFSESLKSVLNQNMKSDYLKLYQDILFIYYNNKILDDKFRTEYLFKLMKIKIPIFSDLIIPQQDELAPNFSSTNQNLIINCFEKCMLIATKEMKAVEFFIFAIGELQNLSCPDIFHEICELVISRMLAVNSYDFLRILPFIEDCSRDEIKSEFKKQVQVRISVSKIPEDTVLRLSKCKSTALQNWALIQAVNRIPSFSHDRLVQDIIVSPKPDSSVFIIIQYFNILNSAEASISIYNFLLEIWESITSKTILIGIIKLFQNQNTKSRKKFALLIHGIIVHTEKIEQSTISENITKIVIELNDAKQSVNCLGRFYDFFYPTEPTIREAADNFKSHFNSELSQTPLFKYTTLPELSQEYAKISSKINNFLLSKTFLRYFTERKYITGYATSAEFIKNCEDSFTEFESNMRILATFDRRNSHNKQFVIDI